MAEGDAPYRVIQKVGENAYKIELPRDMHISTTFNIRDLTLYLEDDDEDLRANPLQGGEVNAKQTLSMDPRLGPSKFRKGDWVISSPK